MTLTSDKWRVKEPEGVSGAASEISEKLGILLPTAKLLCARGYLTPERAEQFITKSTEMFHDPFEMKDMRRAAKRLLDACEKGEKTVIYGDYDVDGVTSVSILHMYLSSAGCDVGYYIPSRSGEGYGMSGERVRTLAGDGVTLIVTVDTGITAAEEAKVAKECGVDLVITDHHECHGTIPDAYAVVNPHRPDCTYPFKELAGVGVVFKLLCAMEILRCPDDAVIDCIRRVCDGYMDLVAIGTVADVMPVTDENRLIVARGLDMLEREPRPAIRELICAINSDGRKNAKRKITTNFIGYTIAPRINAAGRIASASIAVDMFLAESSAEASRLARELCEINLERQNEENIIVNSAYEKIAEQYNLDDCPIIILDDEKWHHGVIGIVASRITEKYQVPSVLISFEGNGDSVSPEDMGKGSGRSVKGMNLVDALASAGDVLEKFGGHELAAGLSVRRKNLPALRERLTDYAREHLSSAPSEAELEADAELSEEDITLKQAQELSLLEPFGVGNASPLFIIRDLELADIVSVGEGKHARLTVMCGGTRVTAMCFRCTVEELDLYPGDRVDIAFSLDINEYQNVRSVQMIVREISPAADILEERRIVRDEYERTVAALGRGEKVWLTVTRADVAAVFTMIRNELKRGHEVFSINALLNLARACGIGTDYVRLRLCLDIFYELDLLGIIMPADPEREIYRFSRNAENNKTDLDRSSIYRALNQN